MRISITLHGKATTISIDDTLMYYLEAYVVKDKPTLHKNTKRQQEWAKQFIREVVLQRPDVPSKDLSQFVQRHILHAIAADGLIDIIAERGPRYKKEPADPAALFSSREEYERVKASMQTLANPA